MVNVASNLAIQAMIQASPGQPRASACTLGVHIATCIRILGYTPSRDMKSSATPSSDQSGTNQTKLPPCFTCALSHQEALWTAQADLFMNVLQREDCLTMKVVCHDQA